MMTPENRPRFFMNEKIKIVWDDDGFASILKEKYGFSVITSHEEWRMMLQRDSAAFDKLVILAELSWNEKPKSEFYGLEIFRELRVEFRLPYPVLICSFMPQKYFLENDDKNLLFNLLKAPGHSFLRLPFDFRKLHKFFGERITEDLLEDIIESLCDLGGLLEEMVHGLKNAVIPSQSNTDPKSEVERAVDRFFNRAALFLPDVDKVIAIKKRLLKELKERIFSQGNYEGAIKVVEVYGEELKMLLIPPPVSKVEKTHKPNWLILFVDDDIHVRRKVVEEFNKRNMTCIAVPSAREAFETLESDEKTNLITVVIADYRLIGANGKWQRLQGYTILKEIFLFKPNLVSFFALTAANRRALLRIQKEFQMRVLVFSKQDVVNSTSGFNIFAQRVREEGESVFDALCNRPTLASWVKGQKQFVKPLNEYYRAHRLVVDYNRAEKEISKESQDYVNRILSAYMKETEPASHKFEFQANLKRTPDDPEALKKFRIKLIGRRIALALYLMEGFNREGIYYALKKHPLINPEESPGDKTITRTRVTQLLNNHLALSLENDIPDHILAEERYWLINVMGIDLNDLRLAIYREIEQVLTVFQDQLRDGEYLDPFLATELRIFNFDRAKILIENAKRIAGKCNEEPLLKNLFSQSWKGIKKDKYLSRAFRASGAKELYGMLEIPDQTNQ